MLGKLNPAKACVPDAISDWLLKEYAELPAHPITIILDSFKELLPSVWKFANVTPVPKKKPVKDLKKDLRPISLTFYISKIAEVKPAVLQLLDYNQFGAVSRSSSTLALFEFEPTTPNMSQHGGQSNARNMLRPTMLRHVALACWLRKKRKRL